MYKLTYESDEEIATDGKLKPAVNDVDKKEEEDVIYDRSSTSSQSDHKTDERKGRSRTAASAIESAYGVTSSQGQGQRRKQKFYEMFYKCDPSENDYPTKSSQRSSIGCKECMLVFYLLFLSFSVVLLAVFFHMQSVKYNLLIDRVKKLEESNIIKSTRTGSDGIGLQIVPAEAIAFADLEVPTAVPKRPPHVLPTSNDKASSTQPEALKDSTLDISCCVSLELRVAAIERDRAIQSPGMIYGIRSLVERLLMQMQTNQSKTELDIKNVKSMVDAVAKDEKQVESKLTGLKSEMDEVVGMVSSGISMSPPNTVNGGRRSVAFNAYHAFDQVASQFPSHNTFVVSSESELARPLFYNYEMINRRKDIIPETGYFTAPFGGHYVFFVSFCTMKSPTTVAIVKNAITLQVFNVPMMTSAVETSNAISRHAFSVVSELIAGDLINLELRRGSIVELSDRAGVDSEICTRFSGFQIS